MQEASTSAEPKPVLYMVTNARTYEHLRGVVPNQCYVAPVATVRRLPPKDHKSPPHRNVLVYSSANTKRDFIPKAGGACIVVIRWPNETSTDTNVNAQLCFGVRKFGSCCNGCHKRQDGTSTASFPLHMATHWTRLTCEAPGKCAESRVAIHIAPFVRA
jgi:hypothetical protein